jgi:alanine racemase
MNRSKRDPATGIPGAGFYFALFALEGEEMPSRAVWAEVDLKAIEHNIKVIKEKIHGNARFCAVVKANAYGHGAIPVAKAAAAAGADYFAVAILKEAIELRDAGFKTPILILGLTPLEQAKEIVDYDITATVFSIEAAEALSKEAVRQHKNVKVHLAVDTGMGRIGVRPEEAGEMAKQITSLENVELEGMFSHFALADSSDKTFAYEQLARFKVAIASVKASGIDIAIKHLANSAATLEMPETHFDMVRSGVILYGLWPSDEVSRETDLRPAMTLKARIAYVKSMQPEETVGYGRTFTVKRQSRIATLPIGYADGYTRLFAGKAQVEIHGKRADVVGRICMDQCMVDVTDIKETTFDDEVVLFGSQTLTTDEAASWIGTINYEIVCMVGARVPRVYK